MAQSSLDKLASEAGTVLKKHGLKLVTAESCTGGGLSYWITAIPGSSDWFDRGFVTYSNQAKIDSLGVQTNTLAEHGAVSEQTVIEMAKGALNHSNATVSIAITGIAGPDGGTKDKPIGTVWIALAKKNAPPKTHLGLYLGNRQEIRSQVIEKALQMILVNI